MEHICEHCGKNFSKTSNLKRHISNIHFVQSKNKEKFLCHLCSQYFTQRRNLERHIEICQSRKAPKNKISCCLCNLSEISKANILQHYSNSHDIDVSTKKLKFKSLTEFECWKDQLEKDTVSKYARVTTRKSLTRKIYYYRCHRDGFFKSGGKNIRRLKRIGSNKINGHCPSKIYATLSAKTGEISVEFLPAHVGHSMELERIPLKKADRDFLAAKIRQKIPFDEILNDFRDTNNHDDDEENNYNRRLHLLTRHDLFNIEQSYNLTNESVRHANDSYCLESWIKENIDNNTSVVRFYKRQGELLMKNNNNNCSYELEKNDFLLIVMNDTQLEVLKKYGNYFICMDSIRGLKPNKLELTYLIVLDNIEQPFPCMFAFSNRSDAIIFKTIFNVIKVSLNGEISPKVFVSDTIGVSYTAWCEEMGPVTTRLYCGWHVNRKFKENVIDKVTNNDKQEILLKTLKNLTEESDEVAFEKMLQICLNDFDFDSDLKNFGTYFKANFLGNCNAWARCYLKHQYGLNSNLQQQLDLTHRTFKNIYAKTKSIRRLDKAIHCMMKIVRDTSLHKGTISNKLKDLSHQHKILSSSITEEFSITTNENCTWTMSFLNETESYKIETTSSNTACNCDITCSECNNSCIHMYTCTCLESSMNWNICKHVHLLCTYLMETSCDDPAVGVEPPSPELLTDYVIEELIIDENYNKKSAETTYPSSYDDINHHKAHLMETFQSYLNSVTTSEDCKVIENALVSIGTIFTVRNSTKNISSVTPN